MITLSFVFFFSIAWAGRPSSIYKKEHPYSEDCRQIQRLVVDIQTGIITQNQELLFMTYLPDSTLPEKLREMETEGMKKAFSNIINSFGSRNLPGMLAYKEKTSDFRIFQRELNFSANGQEAWLDLGIDFANLPADNTALDGIPQDELEQMTDREKEIHSKLRMVRLHFKKITGIWRVSSFGNLAQALNKTTAFYEDKVLPQQKATVSKTKN